tara:strand:- start:101 stop:481 length:381 start_codon:yes stop_codon:yes gene_type:complete
MNNISNKSILIVGANGAIAKETIKHLLIDGAIEIVMACRSETRGLEALEEIKLELSEAKKASISVVGGFDMTVPDKIEIAVNALSTKKTFDIVFLAAGFAVFTDDYHAVEWKGKKIEKNIFSKHDW